MINPKSIVYKAQVFNQKVEVLFHVEDDKKGEIIISEGNPPGVKIFAPTDTNDITGIVTKLGQLILDAHKKIHKLNNKIDSITTNTTLLLNETNRPL